MPISAWRSTACVECSMSADRCRRLFSRQRGPVMISDAIVPRGNRKRVMTLAWGLLAVTALMTAALHGRAQERPATAAHADPRVGLKAGLRDAGEAARNMIRV